jgi:hypothetical protein
LRRQAACCRSNFPSGGSEKPLPLAECLFDMKERDHLEDICMDDNIIEMDLQEIRMESADWIHMAQDRN